MPLYSYRARNGRGDAIRGQLEAATPDAVAVQLINSGVTPIDINEVVEREDILANLKKQLNTRPPNLDDLVLFCRQMYTLTKAGVPIIRAIAGLAETTRNPVLAETIGKLRQELETGRELSTAMSQHERVFSSMMVSMVRVGENTGQLEEAFLQLSQYIEMERDTRARVKAALRYPTFVLVFIMAAVAVVNVMVIPAFAKVFDGMGQELPWQTALLINTSAFFVDQWPKMLVGVLAAFFGVRYYVRTEQGKYRWDKLKLRLPIVGSIILRSTLSRFSRSFAMTSRSGVPLIQALTVTSRAVDNDFVADKVLGMRNGIERGDSLTRTAAATNLFTPLVLQMLSVGEETGAVDDMLDEVADFYEREVDYELKGLSSAIEPILIVAVGVLVLILALGIFVPMWDISSGAGRV